LGDNEGLFKSDVLGCKSGSTSWNLIPSELISKPSGFTKPVEFLDQLIAERLITQDLSKLI